ncbi:hypothetical protein HBH49_159920 [Parastagonospora nodorum]|nr:hypothetical protein HBH49_159920 [Parastagonospora nodorum]
MASVPQRIAYIRTIDEPNEAYNPDKGSDHLRQFLGMYMKQRNPHDPVEIPRHRFVFGASNAVDAHMLDLFLSDWILPSHSTREFANIQRSDLELRLSEPQAGTGEGKRLIERCSKGGIEVVVSGADDAACREIMLQESDYVIDRCVEGNAAWYWNTARSGVRQDNALTNPKYDMAKHHDVSKTRLQRRYAGHGWTANSGCSHGNGGGFACVGCGGKCKRWKCRVNPGVERVGAEWARLPAKGSVDWRELSAEDACFRMQYQRLPSQLPAKEMYNSIDTFSGD